MRENEDLLYRDVSHVKQGHVKIKTSYRVKRILKSVLGLALSFVIIGAMVIFGYSALQEKATLMTGETVEYNSNIVNASIGNKAIVKTGTSIPVELIDKAFYSLKIKEPSAHEIIGIPYSLVRINGELKSLNHDEYLLKISEQEVLVNSENILGYFE